MKMITVLELAKESAKRKQEQIVRKTKYAYLSGLITGLVLGILIGILITI